MRIEIVESDSSDEFKRMVNDFINKKDAINSQNLRVHGPKLYDLRILDSKVIEKDGKVKYIAIIEY
jgi:hypothetical protein